jgi:hypothetical protein
MEHKFYTQFLIEMIDLRHLVIIQTIVFKV